MALLLPFYVPILDLPAFHYPLTTWCRRCSCPRCLDLPAFHYPLTTHLFAEPLPWGGAGEGSVATSKTEE